MFKGGELLKEGELQMTIRSRYAIRFLICICGRPVHRTIRS